VSGTTLEVAAAQIASVPFDVDANVQQHLLVIGVARAAGVEVLVFPELSLTGHAGGKEASRLAIRREHPFVAMLAEAAGAMLVVFGAIERGAGDRYYNAAFAVRDGEVAHVHRKVNLATYGRLDDGRHFIAGERVDIFDVGNRDVLENGRASLGEIGPVPKFVKIDPDPNFKIDPDPNFGGWRAAAMICADTWNPPLVHVAAAQGVNLLLVPVSSALEAVGGDFDNPSGWDVNLRFHALTYGLPIVMANRVGSEDGLTFWGGSRIVDPFGHVIATAAGTDEELVRGAVALADVRRARELLPTIRDANLPLLVRELERVRQFPPEN
jgi:predicted amidohydrolase